MSYKAIEVFYDIASIPGIDPNNTNLTFALDFRNEAMDHIERALVESGLGQWVGAEIGMGEVNFGFEVNDFEKAEELVRTAVADTQFANIREITRFESDEDIDEEEDDSSEYEETEDDLIDRDEIAEALKNVGLISAEQLAMTAAICHRILPKSTLDDLEVAEHEKTQFGGVPEVPESFEWPRRNGKPLAFLAQIDFLEEGERLLFFYDVSESPTGYSPADRGACHVVHVEGNDLKPAVAPSDLPDDCQFREVEMSIQPDIVLPDYASNILKDLDIPKKDLQLLKKLSDEPNENDTASHHLMGHPTLVANDMELPVQLAANGIDPSTANSKNTPNFEAICEGAEDWHLLFQCESDPRTGFDWGNSGRLFFWIDGDDFDKRNFDNVWVIRQTKSDDVQGKN